MLYFFFKYFSSDVIYINISEDIFKYFLKIEVRILFLPKKLFDHPSNNSSQLNIEDATITLSTLNDWINQLNKEGKSYLRLESILKQMLSLSKNHITNICKCPIAYKRMSVVGFGLGISSAAGIREGCGIPSRAARQDCVRKSKIERPCNFKE